MSLSNLLIIFSSSFMALFPVVNPLGNGFVVNGFFTDLDPKQRKTAIQKLIFNFIMIGVGTLVIGHLFLLIFGLAIPVIQLGGGILICKTAMELLADSGSSDKGESNQNLDSFKWKNIEQKIFYPITFPISIGSRQYICHIHFDGLCQCQGETTADRNQLFCYRTCHHLYGCDTVCFPLTGAEDYSETRACRQSDYK